MRKRKRRVRVIKRINLRRKRKLKFKRTRYNIVNGWRFNIHEVVAPEMFNIGNIERVIDFLASTEKFCKKNKVGVLKINLDNVLMIDMYAISLMLSMMIKLSGHKIRFWGTYPENNLAKQFILESGFLDIVRTNVYEPGNRRKGNKIFMLGKDCVDSHRISKAVKETMRYIVGKETIYSPVYEDMVEISSNSVEHANLNRIEKNWLVSICIEGKRVRYILTDTGSGILATLRKKLSQKLGDVLKNRSDEDVLQAVFCKYYQSVTGEINRHKGLPIVYESFLSGFISNFQVLSNKVMIDFEKNSKYDLPKGFNGVMFSWTVSIDNYNNWLKSL